MRAILLWLAIALAPLAALQKGKPDLPAGLTPEEVRKILGDPARIGRQILAHRAVEQWHYGPPSNLRLTFECPRGQQPRLIRTRPARPE